MELRQTRVQVLPPTLVTDAGIAWDMAELESRLRQEIAARQADRERWNTAHRADLARVQEVREELEAFRRKVAERAMEEKEARGWCSELDEVLEDLGLGEFIRRDMEVDINFTVTVENCAPSGPTQGQVDEAAREYINCHLSSEHWTIVDG